MTIGAPGVSKWNNSPLRWLMWGGAGALLLLPAVAMQFTAEVNWGPGDFAIMGALFAVCCGTVELGARLSDSWAYRAGVGVAVLTSFVLIWINLAVGTLGSEGNVANLMFGLPIAVAIGGAAFARGRPAGSALAMTGASATQALVTVVALAAGMGMGESVWPWGFAALMALFTLLWEGSAWLFRTAARAM